MDLKIDTSLLKDLDFNEYAFLYYQYHNLPCPIKLNIDLQLLDDKGYVHLIPEDIVGHSVNLRAKASNLFDVKDLDGKFLEFWGNYPIKAGTRILRSSDSDTQQGKIVKKKYLTIIKKPGTHEKVMRGLLNELATRKKDGSLGFMQMIETYLNQCTYEKYCDLDTEETNKFTVDV